MELSISSLRADSLTEELVASLARGGHRTVTVAPEAGTERLRRAIRKEISDEQLYAACDMIRRHGIPHLKCYFMIGQPTETREDVEAIPGSGRAAPRAPARPRSGGQAVRTPHPLDLFVRPQAVDALPVGALRRDGLAGGQARHHQARCPAAFPTCASSTRIRARPSSRLSWPAATAAWRIFSSGPAPWTATGGARSARVGGGRRLLHDAGPRRRRADAVGPLPRTRVEGQPHPRVGARPGRATRAGAGAPDAVPCADPCDGHGRPCGTCGSRSPIGATCAASTACRKRSTPGCPARRSCTSRRSPPWSTSSATSGWTRFG